MTEKGVQQKVFCIGWHKTGTSTLGLALIKLGYSVLGCRLDMVHPLRRAELDQVLELAGRYDAVQDVPWACLFKELDQRYPSSKFILTSREETSWLESAARHFGSTDIPLHEWIYGEGRLAGNEELYLERFRAHYQEVYRYFRDRPNDLLVLDFQAGDRWDKLCQFLSIKVPDFKFPHENKSPNRRNFKERLMGALRDSSPPRIRRAIFELRLRIRKAQGLQDPRNRFHNFRENRLERETWKNR